MPVEPFVWGAGGSRKTPEEVARDREIADAMLAQGMDFSPVGSWTQGAARVATAAAGAFRGWRANQAEKEGRGGADKVIAALLGAEPAAAPVTAPAAAAASPVAAPVASGNGDFVSSIMPAAMEASQRTGVDPRIIVAQAALESGWGKSAPGNNLFGIKSHGQPGGNTLATTEVVNGQPVRTTDSFRAYASPAESVNGYADFINENPRYAAFKGAQGMDAQIDALGASGYATDPNYAAKVRAIATGLPDMGVQQVADRGGPSQQQLLEAASNPWLSDGQRMVIGALLKQQMERNDPSYQLDMDYKRAQIDALRNKPPQLPNDVQEFIYGQSDPAFRQYQIDMKKAGATNIDARQMGNIPPGYQIVEDPTGGTRRMEPIPGSPAEAEVRAAAERQKAKGEADLERGDFITQEIDRALGAMDAPGILPTTGWGSVFAGTPGTNAKALSSLLDTVKANIGFQQLNQMRQQSPTGGALGNVTEQEMKFLQSVAGSLDQSQNADQLRDNLNRLWNVYMDTVHGKGQGPARRELGFENKGGTIEPPPNGIDPEDWKHMSPEERKLWQ